MNSTVTTTYDEVPYESRPIDATHPSRLAALGCLFGMRPANVEACRVLEIGCATGGNLVPMAVSLPNSQFVGVDLSSVQIVEAKRVAAELPLSNIQFHAMSIMDVTLDFGQFDYIVCHGVYSWVPEPVRQKILSICSANLAPNGLAYVSYNTYPGWRMRGMIRDMMRYHANKFDTPQSRVQQARMLLDFLSRAVENPDSAYAVLLKAELEHTQNNPDFYLLHEQLEDTNDPVYFHEFVEQAASHQLQYVNDVSIQTQQLNLLSSNVAGVLRRIVKNPIEFEQYVDFVRNRTFRRSVLTHKSLKIQHEVSFEALKDLYISTTAKALSPQPNICSPDVVESYRFENGTTLETNNIMTKAAFDVLAEHAPLPLHYVKLRRLSLQKLSRNKSARTTNMEKEERALCEDLFRCCATDAVILFIHEIKVATKPGSHPKTNGYVRFQAQHTNWVTSQFHRHIGADGFVSHLIPLLDGSRDKTQLYVEMMEIIKSGKLPYLVNGIPVYDEATIAEPTRIAISKALEGLAENGVLLQ